jgi:hypothetical protein
MVKNTGQIPQYYVENSHPAIIDKGMWELVQIEHERRKGMRTITHQPISFQLNLNVVIVVVFMAERNGMPAVNMNDMFIGVIIDITKAKLDVRHPFI